MARRGKPISSAVILQTHKDILRSSTASGSRKKMVGTIVKICFLGFRCLWVAGGFWVVFFSFLPFGCLSLWAGPLVILAFRIAIALSQSLTWACSLIAVFCRKISFSKRKR